MRNLYFQRSNGSYLLIKENVADEQEALKEISEFLKRHNYNSYYTRMWYEDNGAVTVFDVGSWTEFFKWAPAAAVTPVGTEADFIERGTDNDL